MPDLYSVMLDQYRQYAQINNVLNMPECFDHERQGIINGINSRLPNLHVYGSVIGELILLLLIITVTRSRHRH
jgi:hypothetical protein